MEQFYTREVSDEVTSSLKSKNYPICQMDMGFTVPQIIDIKPTYAEVLDWLITKDINISITMISGPNYTAGVVNNDKGCLHNLREKDSLINTLDQLILLALDLLDNE